jgi:hypothetical protein
VTAPADSICCRNCGEPVDHPDWHQRFLHGMQSEHALEVWRCDRETAQRFQARMRARAQAREQARAKLEPIASPIVQRRESLSEGVPVPPPKDWW